MPASVRLSCILALLLAGFAGACRETPPAAPKPPTRREAYERQRAAAAAATTTAAPATVPAALPECPGRPNILIVTLDTLRFDATALDPRSGNDTPVLRRLAGEGVNFLNCYSTHDATPQSHFSLFTGYLDGLQGPLDRPEASLAFQLRKLGYRSFGIAANMNISRAAAAWTLPFSHYENLGDEWTKLSEEQKERIAAPYDQRIRAYGGEPNDFYRLMLHGSAGAILPRFERQLAAAKQPFLGFVNLLEPHDPYVPDPKRYSMARERRLRSDTPPPLRYRPLPDELLHPEAIADPVRRELVQQKLSQAQGRAWSVALDTDAATRAIHRARYDAEVRELDARVGQFLSVLDRKGLRNSTIVIITSDHGESFGEEELLTHSFDDRGDIESTHHVPMLVLMPPCYGVRGVAVSAVCTIADIPPTLYELLGVNAKPLWKLARPGNYGRSLLEALKKGPDVQAVPAAQIDLQTPRAMPATQKRQMNEEAQKRLKALGYLQ